MWEEANHAVLCNSHSRLLRQVFGPGHPTDRQPSQDLQICISALGLRSFHATSNPQPKALELHRGHVTMFGDTCGS